MKMIRLTTAAAAALTTSLSLTACGSSDDSGSASGGTYQFIASSPTPLIVANGKGVSAEAKKLGVKLSTSNALTDPTKQTNLVTDAISAGVKAIITTPISSQSLAPVIARANKAGICTIAIYNNFGEEGQDAVYSGSKAFIGTNDVTSTETLTKGIADKMGGKGNLAIVGGIQASVGQSLRISALKSTIAKNYPDIKVVDTQYSNMDPASARTITQNYVQKYGSSLNGIFAVTDSIGVASADVIAKSDLADKVVLGAIGGSEQFFSYIQQGKAYAAVPQTPISDGEQAIQLAKQCVEGDKKPVVVDSLTLPAVAALADTDYLVTPESVSKIEAQY